MNSSIARIEKNGKQPQWRENPCQTDCKTPEPCKPDKPTPDPKCPEKCTEVIREKESKETHIHEIKEVPSDSLPKLTRFLLGLTGLLLLGSILSNLLMVWAFTRIDTTSTHTEITNTSHTETSRVTERIYGDEYYYYAPPARW
ncbi:hypothetical protein [Egbenema bharatensis]|uniref:hypothetical protein n=1 Tax=Egbenema bharatensis TaxID=3463334 RepID=UPI003A8B0165